MRTLRSDRTALPTAAAKCRYGVMKWPKGDEILGRSLGQYGEWAQAEIDLLVRFIKPGSDVIDVGAFVGTHATAFAAQNVHGCTVHAYEAHPDYVRILRDNLKANGFTSVKVHPVALSDRSGKVVLQVAGASSQTNFGGARFGDNAGQGEGLSVPTERLDGLTLRSCSLIKIDAEGMELRVLLGAEETLRLHRPVVYTECNAAAEGWPVIQHMSAHDYLCWLFCFAAFNPGNFRGSTDNFFGAAREIGLLFLPKEQMSQGLGQLIDGEPLAPVQSVDDLLLGLLRKPQYKYEVLACGPAASVLGADFWLNEPEALQLRQALQTAEIASLAANNALATSQAALDVAQQLAWSRASELSAAQVQGDRLQAALDEVQALAHRRADELRVAEERLQSTQAAHEESQRLAIARARELDSLQRHVTSLAAQLADSNAQLNRLQAALDEAQQLAIDRYSQIEALSNQLEAEQARRVGLSAETEVLSAALYTAQSLAWDRHGEIQALSTQLNATQSALEDTQALAVARLTEVRTLAARLEQTQAALEETQQLARARASEISTLVQHTDGLQTEVAQVRDLAAWRAAEIDRRAVASGALQSTLEATSSALEDRERQVRAMRDEKDRLSRELAEHAKQLARLSAVESELAATRADLASAVEADRLSQREQERLVEELVSARDALAVQAERNRRLTNSLYWRAGAPIRWLASLSIGKSRTG